MEGFSGTAFHSGSGRLLAHFAGDDQLLRDKRELAQASGLSLAELEVMLDWLVELELLQSEPHGAYRLGRGRKRAARENYHLLLHVEPDATTGSLCRSLLAEDGYPSIGADDSSAAMDLLDGVEFDLALLCGLEQEIELYRDTQAALIDRLDETPLIIYGTAPRESDDPLPPFSAVLPGPLEGALLLEAIHSILPR